MMTAEFRKKVDPEITALIVIDMQKDYCCKDGILDKMGFDTTNNQKLALRLSKFINKARNVIPKVIHLKMTHIPHLRSDAMRAHYERVGLQRKFNPTFSDFFGVIPKEEDIVIPKYRYSGFISTYLNKYLSISNVKTLVLTGVATNVCVESTAREAFMHDYNVVIPKDLTEGTSEEAKKWSLQNIDMFFGEVVSSKDLEIIWGIKAFPTL